MATLLVQAQPMKPLLPVTLVGRYFYAGHERFLVNGVVYNPHHIWDRPGGPPPDALADDQIGDVERSIPLLKDLGINTILVFCIDENKQHDNSMKLLAKAGIYVLPCLTSFGHTISPDSPAESYTPRLLKHCLAVVDAMEKYPNTLGFMASVNVITDTESTRAAPVIRAVVRDVKKYLALLSAVKKQRLIPVGISVRDVYPLRKLQFEYFAGGGPKEAIDFFSLENFLWKGKSTMVESGYQNLMHTYYTTHVPVFFSEYGNNEVRPRLFKETIEMLTNPTLLNVFSGGIVREFFNSPKQYGLIERVDNPVLARVRFEKRDEFRSLRWSLKNCYGPYVCRTLDLDELQGRIVPTAGNIRFSTSRFGVRPDIPPQSKIWLATWKIPFSPLDWGNIKSKALQQEVDDEEWNDVAVLPAGENDWVDVAEEYGAP